MLLIKNSQHMGREVRRSISRILSTWELGGKIRESGSLGAWESKARELSRRRGKSPSVVLREESRALSWISLQPGGGGLADQRVPKILCAPI